MQQTGQDLYDMRIIDSDSQLQRSPNPSEPSSSQTPLQIHVHRGFLCLFPSYLLSHNMTFSSCYESMLQTNHLISTIQTPPKSLMKNQDIGILAKMSSLQQNISKSDLFIGFWRDQQSGQIKKSQVKFDEEKDREIHVLERKLEKYKQSNRELLQMRKQQFDRERQEEKQRQDKERLEQQEWKRRIQAREEERLRREKEETDLLERLQQESLRAERIRQEAIRKENEEKRRVQDQQLKRAEQQDLQKQRMVQLIQQNKLRNLRRRKTEWQTNSSADQSKSQSQKEQAKFKFYRAQQRQIDCVIM